MLNVHNVHNSHNGFATLAAGSGVVGGRVVALASPGGAADLCVSSKPRRGNGPKAKTAMDRDIQIRCSAGRGCGVFAVAVLIGADCGYLNQSKMLDMFYNYNDPDRITLEHKQVHKVQVL